MNHIAQLQEKMDVLSHKFRTYKDDVRYHKGWANEEALNEKSKLDYLEALNNLVAASLPHESNAIAVGQLTIYSPVRLDDIGALIQSANIPANVTNSN
jgi:hypothetical protein